MSNESFNDLDRTRLDWPEPLLIDLICDTYGATQSMAERIAAARLQVRFLRELVEGELRQAAFLRLELIAFCAARAIDVDAIDAADQAAFRELLRIVETRFRNSPKLRQHFTLQMYQARDRLPARSEPRTQTATIRALSAGRGSPTQSFMPVKRRLPVNG